MLIDGKFDDWDLIDPIHEDAANDVNNFDFTKIWVASDAQFIYLSFQLNTEFNIQEDNGLTLFMDIDDNVNTGSTSQNSRGADLIFNFGSRAGSLIIDGRTNNISHADIGLFTAPTVSSDRFEIAFRRDDAFYNETVFSSPRIQFFFSENFGDRAPDANSIEYALNEPDILAFQEVNDITPSVMRDLMDDILPTAPTGETWEISKVDPDIIMVSKFKLVGQQTLRGGGSSSAGNGVFVYEMPEFGTDLVFINCHLPCCGSNGNRQEEVDNIMKFVRDYKSGNTNFDTKQNAPIIIAGDMNLVGFNEQLNTFLTGDILNENIYGSDFAPDWDGTDFDDALPYTTNYPSAFTWYNPNSSFNPGRLDFIIYAGASLDLRNSYSLFTLELPQDTLDAYGLNSNDILGASDHLPIVADFKVRNVSSTNNISASVESFEVSPNPIEDNFTVKFDLKKQQNIELAVYNYTGQLIQVLKKERLVSGTHQFSFTENELRSGLYFLTLKTEDGVVSLKIIK